MTVTVTTRNDINLETVLRVAWQNERVTLSEAALSEIARCRTAFLNLIAKDPSVVIYGVTTAMGELAHTRLSIEERERH
ncbi:aromatic amino acid ammonia-lyase, partial [Marinobacter sp. 71-i]